nr:(2Fe-2S)-binding protein [Sinobaca sp. H24]
MKSAHSSTTEKAIHFQVNKQQVTYSGNPAERMADVLRDDLQQTGTKISCGIGRCGACSILVDGELMNACLIMPCQLEGSSITTIEGIGSKETMDPIQEAFLTEGGFQCGYCTPGMIVAAKALLDKNSDPSVEEIQEGLAGNLCRCTGYASIIRAVQKAAETLASR